MQLCAHHIHMHSLQSCILFICGRDVCVEWSWQTINRNTNESNLLLLKKGFLVVISGISKQITHTHTTIEMQFRVNARVCVLCVQFIPLSLISDQFRYCGCLLLLFRPFFSCFLLSVNDRWTLCQERNICVKCPMSVKETDSYVHT